MKRYNISREFGFLRVIKPPLNKGILPIANTIISLTTINKMKDKHLSIEKRKIKSFDDMQIDIYIIKPLVDEVNLPCLVYYHGGAFVFGPSFAHFYYAKQYAYLCKCVVVFVDYRLAPQHPFISTINDALYSYRFVYDNYLELGINQEKIAVGGDSAGGCLATMISILVNDSDYPKPYFQFLIYPVLDKRMNSKSMEMFVDTPSWNAKLNKKMWEMFLQGEDFISPNEIDDMSIFPKTYIETAEYDCLRDEALDFAAKLNKHGIEVIVNQTKNTIHGYDVKRSAPISKQNLQKRIAAIQQFIK